MNSAPNDSSLTSPARSESSGQTPDQPPASNIPSADPVQSTETPVTVVSSAMTAQSVPPTETPINPPTDTLPNIISSSSPPPPVLNEQVPVSSHHHHFPFMMVTLFLVIILAGFAGSFLFFRYTNPTNKKLPAAKIAITPAVTIAPTAAAVNPFATASSDLTTNPFASPTATNPFGTYQNPFASATPSGNPNQPYQNPF